MLRAVLAASVVALVLLTGSPAAAKIVLFPSEPPIDPILEMLRIQLGPDRVKLHDEPLTGPPGARIEKVKQVLEQTQSTFGVWLEYSIEGVPSEPPHYTAFAVRRAREGETAEVFRFRAQLGMRGDRALALGLAELYLEQTEPRSEVAASARADLTVTAPPAVAKPKQDPIAPERTSNWGVQVGTGIATRSGIEDDAPELLAVVLLGAAHKTRGVLWQLSAFGEAALPASLSTRAGEVELHQIAAGAGAAVLFGNNVRWGPTLELPFNLLLGEAQGPRSRGREVVLLPSARILLRGAGAFSDTVQVALGMGVELRAWDQSFTVDGQSAVRLRRIAPAVRLELHWIDF